MAPPEDPRPLSSTEKLALRQVEYYFSDESYPFDEYIKSKVEEGWIKLSEIASFPKMKTITEDHGVIASAMRGSDTVEVSDDGLKLKRKFPTPDADPDAPRTAYACGFQRDADKEKLEGVIKDWMGKHGTVQGVRALRDLTKGEDRELDGSAFVAFSSEGEAAKAAAANGAVFKGRKLTIYTMPDWFARLLKKRDAIKKKKEDTETRKKERKSSVAAKIPPGSVLSFAGLRDDTTREAIREAIKAHTDLPIKWIDYEKGQPEAFVRFESPDVAKTVLDALGDTLDVNTLDKKQKHQDDAAGDTTKKNATSEKRNNKDQEDDDDKKDQDDDDKKDDDKKDNDDEKADDDKADDDAKADEPPPTNKKPTTHATVSLLRGDGHAAYVSRAAEAITQSQQKRKHGSSDSRRNNKNRRLS